MTVFFLNYFVLQKKVDDKGLKDSNYSPCSFSLNLQFFVISYLDLIIWLFIILDTKYNTRKCAKNSQPQHTEEWQHNYNLGFKCQTKRDTNTLKYPLHHPPQGNTVRCFTSLNMGFTAHIKFVIGVHFMFNSEVLKWCIKNPKIYDI